MLNRKFRKWKRTLNEHYKKKYDIKSGGDSSTTEIMRKATRFNKFFNFRSLKKREKAYKKNFTRLIEENGASQGKINVIENGYCIDSSQSLPHLQQLIKDTDEIIETRKGISINKTNRSRSFFQNIIQLADLENYPSITNFLCSSEVLTTICNHLRYIPTVSDFTPPGIRLIESSIKYDDTPEKGPHSLVISHRSL